MVGTKEGVILVVALVLGAGAIGLTACGDDESATTVTETTTQTASEPPTQSTSTTSSTSTTTTTTATESTGETTTTESEDVSGNCDEAEHANDPECTGGVEDEDNSGSSGGNSGPG